MQKRLKWIDQARGLSIFLVVYGHNFPSNEPYIYSFHVPLFFLIAGMFHPDKVDFNGIVRRAKMILIPYFFWAAALYLFWFFLGRNYGDSAAMDASPIKNLIGIFYAQGGSEYMEWGIPLWFLPCIFVVYLLRSAVRSFSNQLIRLVFTLVLVVAGFLAPSYLEVSVPWSIDVAMVALLFYTLGGWIKPMLMKLSTANTAILLLLCLALNLGGYALNPEKVDMYRSIYGSPIYFALSGIGGAMAALLLFKLIPVFGLLSYLGKHTIVLLATHIRMLTLIKIVAFFIFGVTVFEFSEAEKFLVSVAQVIMVIPVIWLVNKFVPILDGKVKKA